jgi:peptide/nickel transport system permease protein
VAATILGEAATPENISESNAELGLDRPFFVQYFDWAGNVLSGDLGRSPIDNRSVFDSITEALPVTLELVVLSTSIALLLAIGSALWSARRPGGIVDRVSGALTSASLSIPTFVLGPVLLYFLAVQSQIFPVTGWNPLSEGIGANLETAFLPAICIAVPEFAVFQRLFRGDLVATLDEDYIEAARARGISEGRIMTRHAFRPASISLMTVTGISIGRLLGGTVVVESLFVLPGLGQLLQQSIIKRDLIMVQGIVVFVAVAYVVINLTVDILYGVVDPRIRARAGR